MTSETRKKTLHIAAQEGDVETAEQLLRKGADINEPLGFAMHTPLIIAADHNQKAVVVVLLKYKPHLELPDDETYRTERIPALGIAGATCPQKVPRLTPFCGQAARAPSS